MAAASSHYIPYTTGYASLSRRHRFGPEWCRQPRVAVAKRAWLRPSRVRICTSGASGGAFPPKPKTQKKKASSFELAFRAGDGIRTHDVNLGKPARRGQGDKKPLLIAAVESGKEHCQTPSNGLHAESSCIKSDGLIERPTTGDLLGALFDLAERRGAHTLRRVMGGAA